MPHNRIASPNSFGGEMAAVAVIAAAPELPVVLIPGSPNFALWQQHLFQMAHAWAQRILAPPRHERLLSASWN